MKAMVLTGHGGLDKYAWHDDWPTAPAPSNPSLARWRRSSGSAPAG